MNRIRSTLAALATLTLSATLAAPAIADDWPSRPVRIVSSYAAGGTADILARIVAEHLSTAFKQQFFVETRAGAGGQIFFQALKQKGEIVGSRCAPCAQVYVPARRFCERCFGELTEQVKVGPDGTVTIYDATPLPEKP